MGQPSCNRGEILMLYFIIAALIVMLDQISKYYLTLQLSSGPDINLIPGVIRLTYQENTGAAFSFMSDMRWVLVGISSVVVIVIIAALIKYRDKFDLVLKLGLAAVLGGAFSNLLDRVIFGYVADFFEFQFVRFAVFNVADIFITIGGIVFCIYYLFNHSKFEGISQETSFRKRRGQKNAFDKNNGGADNITPEDESGANKT